MILFNNFLTVHGVFTAKSMKVSSRAMVCRMVNYITKSSQDKAGMERTSRDL